MRIVGLFLAGLIGIALATGTGVGQGDKKDTKAKGQLRPGWKDLTDLSETQKEKIYKIQAQYKTKLADLQAQMKKLNADQLQDELNVLTESQKTELRKKLGGDEKKTDK